MKKKKPAPIVEGTLEPEAPPPDWLLEDLKNSPASSISRKRRKTETYSRRLEKKFVAAKGPARREKSENKVPERQDADFVGPIIKWDEAQITRRHMGKYRSTEMRASICAYARSGASEYVILQLMGINQRQLAAWFKSDPEFRRDYGLCKGAWYNNCMEQMLSIASAKFDWKAYQWLLERELPHIYGPNAQPPVDYEFSAEGAVPTNMDPATVVARLQALTDKAKAALDVQMAKPAEEDPKDGH